VHEGLAKLRLRETERVRPACRPDIPRQAVGDGAAARPAAHGDHERDQPGRGHHADGGRSQAMPRRARRPTPTVTWDAAAGAGRGAQDAFRVSHPIARERQAEAIVTAAGAFAPTCRSCVFTPTHTRRTDRIRSPRVARAQIKYVSLRRGVRHRGAATDSPRDQSITNKGVSDASVKSSERHACRGVLDDRR
jgi:hypothetical protein